MDVRKKPVSCVHLCYIFILLSKHFYQNHCYINDAFVIHTYMSIFCSNSLALPSVKACCLIILANFGIFIATNVNSSNLFDLSLKFAKGKHT